MVTHSNVATIVLLSNFDTEKCGSSLCTELLYELLKLDSDTALLDGDEVGLATCDQCTEPQAF